MTDLNFKTYFGILFLTIEIHFSKSWHKRTIVKHPPLVTVATPVDLCILPQHISSLK